MNKHLNTIDWFSSDLAIKQQSAVAADVINVSARQILWLNHDKPSLHIVIWIFLDLTIIFLWLNHYKSRLLHATWISHDLPIKPISTPKQGVSSKN